MAIIDVITGAINDALINNKAYRGFMSGFVNNDDSGFVDSNNVMGTFGDTVFSIATNGESVKIHTFDNYKRSTKARYATHDIHLRKQLTEFLGVDADSVTLSIRLDAFYGVSPETEAEKLRTRLENGKYDTLIIGGTVVGDFTITDLGEAQKNINNQGKIVVSELDITLLEYVPNALY